MCKRLPKTSRPNEYENWGGVTKVDLGSMTMELDTRHWEFIKTFEVNGTQVEAYPCELRWSVGAGMRPIVMIDGFPVKAGEILFGSEIELMNGDLSDYKVRNIRKV